MTRKRLSFNLGFTIVELLIVMVVIGIVATVTLISFAGISSKAVVATLQSDLTNARRSILNFQAQSTTSSFPTSITACPTPGATELCLTPTAGNTFSYTVNNNTNPPVFTLTATNGSSKYLVDDRLATSIVPSLVSDGLLLNLDAGDSTSYPGLGTTWKDLSGNGDSTLYNGVSYSANNGGSLVFDGIDDYVDTGRDISWNNTNSVTIDIWAKFTISQFKPFIGKGTDWEWEIFQNTNNTMKFIYWNTSGGHTNGPIIDTSSVLSLNSWQNVAFVWSHIDNKQYIYINGSLVSTGSWVSAGINANKTNTVKIGGSLYSWMGSGNYWKGQIATVHYYNRALTPTEIVQNFNALQGRYGS